MWIFEKLPLYLSAWLCVWSALAVAARYDLKSPSMQMRAVHPFRTVVISIDSPRGNLVFDMAKISSEGAEFTLQIPGPEVFRKNRFLELLLRGFETPAAPEPDWEFHSTRFDTVKPDQLGSGARRVELGIRGVLKVGPHQSHQHLLLDCAIQEYPTCNLLADWEHEAFALPRPRFLGLHGKGVWRFSGELAFAPEGTR